MVDSGCINCGSCMRKCPLSVSTGRDRFPGPRALVIDAPRFNPRLEVLRDPLLLCTSCSKCQEVCPSNLDIPRSIIQMRAGSFKEKELLEGHNRLVRNIDLYGRAISPSSRHPRSIRKEGGVLYFPGCIQQERQPSSYRHTVLLLDRVEGDFSVPSSWSCCGSPLEKIGDKERLRKMIEANASLMEARDALVTSCPGCIIQLNKNYGVRPLHTIEYLHESIGLKRIKWKGPKAKLKVTLHHPCHLVRSVGPHVMDYAKEMILEIPNVIYKEMEEADSCCGGGGGVASGHPETALDMARRKVDKAREAGADLILAPCPFCVVNLNRAGNAMELISFLKGCVG